ncbi:MAG: BLUF domain-containing protein [Litorimonas sp.]
MFQLIYESAPRIALTQHVLRDVARKCAKHNAGHDVTGVLFMSGNTVIQFLEGPEDAVRDVFAKVCADVRHMDCRVLLERTATERSFPAWPMAFCEAGSDDAAAIESLLTVLRGRVPAEPDRLAS